ncbi:PhyR family response regulator anti-anti-sigma factor [Falsiroseomonas sp. CW058]|uniref:PhyR family response regulator anti-anti-sigma factor n=1 Tax=Falsiroseomonas sp. CW058 TaxID=3388664 RepID=UPI003D31AAFF
MSRIDRAALIGALPYARRYARALTGSQARGDALVADALRAGVPDVPNLRGSGLLPARVALYAAIGRMAGTKDDEGDEPVAPLSRRLLLLTSLEELDLADAAAAVGLSEERAAAELAGAREKLRAGVAARVLIIEDEPIIALDLQQLVESAGHEVVGVAASEDEAVAIAEAERPSLVLADINLGEGGDGAHAVSRILAGHSAPVIFVTAYPERLLTGQQLEPAFVITKPFEPTTLAVATFQAVTRGMKLDRV